MSNSFNAFGIVNLAQGSAEWLAYRADKFNASDAPAMMGCSPHKTRAELLKELHLGLSREFSDYHQKRVIDPGHAFEALARPIAEKILNEELYPVTGCRGRFSASFDGLTLMNDTAFEHKRLNENLREAMFSGCEGSDLPIMYRVQMEHQLMVSGAEKVLFMASEWGRDGTLIEERHCYYTSDNALRDTIVAGWAQFEADLAAYVPPPESAPPAIGKAPETLPALRIEVSGAVTASNLAEFKDTAMAAIGRVNRDLHTDQDFADAEKAVQWCSDVESRLKAAKEHALSQTASIDALFKTMDDISAEARRVRLELDKLVKARKDTIRGEIVAEGVAALSQHILGLNTRLGGLMAPVRADFGGAVKGKRTVTGLRAAVDNELAKAKVEANQLADKIEANVGLLHELTKDRQFLFSDRAVLVQKDQADLRAIIEQRLAAHDRQEQERKAAQLQQEAERAAAEQKARETAVAEAKAMEEAPVVAPEMAFCLNQQVAHEKAIQLEQNPPAPEPSATIKLGDINNLLAPVAVTAQGLSYLGFDPVETQKNAKLYRASNLQAICAAICNHVTKVSHGHTR